MMPARGVLPRPGGPWSSTWSSASPRFYASSRIQEAAPALQQARIALCIGVRNVIRSVLTMFKFQVPDKM